MTVEFDKSFHKSIVKLGNQSVASEVGKAIENVELASSYENISSFKKLKGFRDYYRIRIGNFRIGLKRIDAGTLRFIVVAHRKDIYRLFP